jgi:hypothetical protein
MEYVLYSFTDLFTFRIYLPRSKIDQCQVGFLAFRNTYAKTVQ